MRRTLLPLLLLAAAACSRGHGPPVISRRSFVRANVALRVVPDSIAHGDSLRRAALRRAGVTPGELRRFVAVHGGHAGYMAEVWREIADSVQAHYVRSGAAARDSAALNAPGQAPPGGIPSGTGFNPPAPAGGPRPPLVVPQGERPQPAGPRPPAPTLEHPPAPAPGARRRPPPPPDIHTPIAPRPGDTLHH